MEIVISGISCFVDPLPPKTGKTVILRNALQGGMHQSTSIPPHYAFIHAKKAQVDMDQWGSGWLGTEDNVMLWLTGDYLTFDPMPRGGTIDLSALPHVVAVSDSEPICSAADEIRPGFRENPSSRNVLALIDLPADAPVTCGRNEKGAAYAKLHIDSDLVTITATPFSDGTGSPRSIRIMDPNAQVFIANVDINSYLLGDGAPDDSHKYLVCEVFGPRGDGGAADAVDDERAVAMLASVESALPQYTDAVVDQVSLRELRCAAGRDMPDFLSTFAAGCSASQWP